MRLQRSNLFRARSPLGAAIWLATMTLGVSAHEFIGGELTIDHPLWRHTPPVDGARGDDLQLLITGDLRRTRIFGLSGSDDEVEKAFEVCRVHRKIVPMGGEDYTANQSASVDYYNAQHGFVRTLDKDEPAENRTRKVARLLDGASGVAAGDRV